MGFIFTKIKFQRVFGDDLVSRRCSAVGRTDRRIGNGQGSRNGGGGGGLATSTRHLAVIDYKVCTSARPAAAAAVASSTCEVQK